MITPEQRVHFLREVRAGKSIKLAAAAAGIHRPRVYTLRDRDPQFAALLADARQAAKPEPPEERVVVPRGFVPADLTKRQRRLLRDVLDVWDKPPEPHEMNTEERTQWAFDQWLEHKEWPDVEIHEQTLGRLSRRALTHYRRHRLRKAAEHAANEPDDAGE